MKTLNSTEAFAAMMAGQNIMCRAIGELIEFNDLDQFPATVFAMPDYEFCIKIEKMNVAGIEFTKPLNLDEYQEEQEVFVINTYNPSIYVVNFKTSALVESINNGFVQRDADNAKLQLQALSKVLGFEINSDIKIIRLGEEPKKQKPRIARKKTEETTTIIMQNTVDDLYASFEYQILQATTSEALIKIRSTFSANGNLNDEQHKDLNTYVSEKLTALDPKQYTPKIEQQKPDLSKFDESVEYQSLLNDLVNRAQVAATPTETTALTGYTKSWTDVQRKPLIDAIHKRLNELNIVAEPAAQPPSLMVRIQNSLNEPELNELLPEIRSRHPDIQPKLMDCVRIRRSELKNSKPSGVVQE